MDNQRRCFSAGIVDDEVVESQEMFNLSFRATSPFVAVMNTAVLTIIDDDGDCGPPPSSANSEYTLSGPSAMNQANVTVSNDGAVATYSCVAGFRFSGDVNTEMTSICVLNTTNAMWMPSEAPVCEEGMFPCRFRY